jgi:hypothetical protein
MLTRYLPICLLCALTTPACSDDDDKSEPEPAPSSEGALDEIDGAQDRWTAGGSRSYEMVVERQCFCEVTPVDDVAVTVADGEVVEALGSEPGQRHEVLLNRNDYMPWFTIAGQFEMIHEAIAAHKGVDAEFDPDDGHPDWFAITPRPEDLGLPEGVSVTDTQTDYVISGFSLK